jgi:hypothetical protein
MVVPSRYEGTEWMLRPSGGRFSDELLAPRILYDFADADDGAAKLPR